MTWAVSRMRYHSYGTPCDDIMAVIMGVDILEVQTVTCPTGYMGNVGKGDLISFSIIVS